VYDFIENVIAGSLVVFLLYGTLRGGKMTSHEQGINAIRWAPRVECEHVARLYRTEAEGRLDDVLLEDVCLAIYWRLQSVTIATQAALGRVECPRCHTVIQRKSAVDKAEVIHCPDCNWQVTWEEYFGSYHEKHLIWGGAYPAVVDFMDGYLTARTTRDKLMLLDRFIHYCHWEMIRHAARPAATMVLDGKQWQVVALIEQLAYSDVSDTALTETRRQWYEKHQPEFDDPGWKDVLHAEAAKHDRESIEFAARHRRMRLKWLEGGIE